MILLFHHIFGIEELLEPCIMGFHKLSQHNQLDGQICPQYEKLMPGIT